MTAPPPAPIRPNGHGRLQVLAYTLAVMVAQIAAACSPTDDPERASCREAVRQAAAAIEPADELRLLDDGLIACDSYQTYSAELERYPGLLGYSVDTFIERRCGVVTDPELIESPTCLTANPPTTPPTTVVVELLFVGTTLDGRLVELRPTPELPFIDDVPAEIQRTVDITFSEGCEGLRAQRDRWVAVVDGSPAGDVASVYAQHAQNVATFTGCDIGTVEIDSVNVSVTAPATTATP